MSATTPSQAEQHAASASQHEPPSVHVAGVIVLVGAVGLLIAQILKTRITTGLSGRADVNGFVALATNQFWIPLKIAQAVGFMLLVLGLAYLFRELVVRGEGMPTVAWVFAAVVAALVRIIEFNLGVLIVQTFISSQGGSLTQAQFEAVIQVYRALGDGLIFVISVFT